MKALISLIAALASSIAVYGVAFSTVLKMPLTMGFIKEAYDLKADYARAIEQPKFVVLAGSNAFFGIRCQTIEEISGIPCVNASVTVSLGSAVIFEKGRELISPGDTVLMPLEYQVYLARNIKDASLPYLVSYEPQYLNTLDSAKRIQAFFSFGFTSFVVATGETALRAMGVRRRISVQSLTPNGDFMGHTEEIAAPYQASIGPAPIPDAAELDRQSPGWKVVQDFLEWATANKVRVVGMLPATIDLEPVSDELERALLNLYENSGHDFFKLPNKNQFHRRCFFESYYHLHEGCQIDFSRRLVLLLRKNDVMPR